MNDKSVNIISDAIRNKKARDELDKLRTEKIASNTISNAIKNKKARNEMKMLKLKKDIEEHNNKINEMPKIPKKRGRKPKNP